MKERIFYFDTIKFCLMMFVIIHHCSMPYLILCVEEWVSELYTIIMPFTMSLFTLISGYFYKEKAYVDRINTYLIPFIVFGVLNLCLQFLSPVSYIHNRPIFQLGYAMWYLWVLFFYTIVTQIVIKKVPVLLLFVGSLILAILCCRLDFFKAEYFQISRLISHYPFFLFGILIREKQMLRWRENTMVRRFAFMVFLVFLIGNFFLSKYGIVSHFIPAFDHSIGRMYEFYGLLVCTIMSFCILLFIPNKEYAITKFGRNTFAAYVLHMSIIFPICWIYGIPYMNTWYGWIIYMVVTPLLCILLFTTPVTNFVRNLLNFIAIK